MTNIAELGSKIDTKPVTGERDTLRVTTDSSIHMAVAKILNEEKHTVDIEGPDEKGHTVFSFPEDSKFPTLTRAADKINEALSGITGKKERDIFVRTAVRTVSNSRKKG